MGRGRFRDQSSATVSVAERSEAVEGQPPQAEPPTRLGGSGRSRVSEFVAVDAVTAEPAWSVLRWRRWPQEPAASAIGGHRTG